MCVCVCVCVCAYVGLCVCTLVCAHLFGFVCLYECVCVCLPADLLLRAGKHSVSQLHSAKTGKLISKSGLSSMNSTHNLLALYDTQESKLHHYHLNIIL